MVESFLWYDFETSGTDVGFDRPLQFAAIRTDMDLKPVEEPINLFCYPGDDLVPDPTAMQVTGLKMRHIQTVGLTEFEFAKQIHSEFSRPGTCVVGYNSIRFDDEFTRYLLYRNFFDPYAREWQGGNSRWDVIDLFRMAAALRPEGIAWPTRDDGNRSFKLEHLTAANGVSHEGAHDAVADVEATIGMVRKLKSAQPRLYDFSLANRRKKAVLDLLYPLGKAPLVHVSSMYPAEQQCLAVVLPLTVHPTNPNGIICVDLSADLEPLLTIGPDELHQRLFSKQAGSNLPRIPLKTIHVNRCPAVAPLGTIKGSEERLGIDLDRCHEQHKQLQQTAGLVEKVSDAFAKSEFAKTSDPDLMLYQGDFFGAEDRQAMQAIHDTISESGIDRLAGFSSQFRDARLPEMLFRFRARNYPDSLSDRETERWQTFVRAKRESQEGLDRQERLAAAIIEEPNDPVLMDLSAYLKLT